MGLLDRITSMFDDWHAPPGSSAIYDPAINPATGLPMTGGAGGVDVLGSSFGTDLSRHRHEGWNFATSNASSISDERSSQRPDSGSWNNMGGGHDPWRD